MDQEKFLKNFAKILGAGAQEELSKIEAKKKKENQLLEIFSSSLSKVAEFEVSASDILEEPKEVIIPSSIIKNTSDKINQPTYQNKSVKRSKQIQELNTSLPLEFKKESDLETASVKKELELIKKSVSDFQKLLQRQSQQISIAASSPGSGEVRVARMDDVNRTLMKEAANGQVLTYDSSTSKWYPATPSGVGYTGSAANPSAPVRQLYVSDGVTTTYTVLTGYAPGQLDVYIDGIKIINGYEVDVSNGSTFTLAVAPDFGANIEVVGSYIFNTNPSWPALFGPQGYTGSTGPANGYTGSLGYTGSTPNPSAPVRQNYISDGTTTTFTVDSGYTPYQLDVYVNGIKLFNEYEADVSNGTTFTLYQAPDFGSNIEVIGSYIFSTNPDAAALFGATGFTGSQGFIGYTGSAGSGSGTGYSGSAGYTGSTGSQGTTGYTGSIGSQGTSGYTGSTGSQGTSGYTGSVGFANGYNLQVNTFVVTNTSTFNSDVTIKSMLRTTGFNNFGSNTFTKSGFNSGDIALDSGATDTPGVLLYYNNNSNYGIDSWNGSFNILSGQLFRVTNNLNESGGSVKLAIDTSGNMVTTGFIKANSWRAGQVVNDIMLGQSELTQIQLNGGNQFAIDSYAKDFITYSYTPLSTSSYITIHFHLSKYNATQGTGNDSWYSQIKLNKTSAYSCDSNGVSNGSEIVYSWQSTVNGNRTGTLFPLIGRYTNSDTDAKTIAINVRRDSADDYFTYDWTSTSVWMRITEIAR